MNKEIEMLYTKLDAQDKIINTQALEIARLKEDKKKAIEWVKKNQYYFPKPIELLEILGDKEWIKKII